MQIAILSDIHGNLPAFEAVLKDIDSAGGADMYWSLGDIVGYGPFPNECIERLRSVPHVAIPGNHDYGVIGKASLEDFNSDAKRANLWSRDQLSAENLAYIQQLPEIRRIAHNANSGALVEVQEREEAAYTLVHGSPRDYIWEYLLDTHQAAASFALLDTPYCFLGHTHVPLIFAEVNPSGQATASGKQARPLIGMVHPESGDIIELDSSRMIINPGSIGQPRDNDPRAAYALYNVDAGTILFRRVNYDISRTQQAIIDAGLPVRLALRLNHGL